MDLQANARIFRNHIIDSGYVLDPKLVHSEFASGLHGQKLDFDKIDESSPLYQEWVRINRYFIRECYGQLPELIIGVANGTNRLALDTARGFNGEVVGLASKKDPIDSKTLYLSRMAMQIVSEIEPELVVVVEDVGTTGSNSVQVVESAKQAGAKNVEVLVTWKRREKLEMLDKAKIPYRAIINETLPTYTPELCREIGLCALNWDLRKRPK